MTRVDVKPMSSKNVEFWEHQRVLTSHPYPEYQRESSADSDSSGPFYTGSYDPFEGLPNRSPCQCGVCGKKYKHRSCLYKHLWEHHDSWETCLKYNLTKHQQVQMMEAAQVLVDMLSLKLV